jgi:hypothetical protein
MRGAVFFDDARRNSGISTGLFNIAVENVVEKGEVTAVTSCSRTSFYILHCIGC